MKFNISKKWFQAKAHLEHGQEIGAGMPPTDLPGSENTAMVWKPTIRQRLAMRLFPTPYCEWPEGTPEAKSICSETRVHLSFLDRLRVLLTGRCAVTVKTVLEKDGSAVSQSVFCVHCPRWLSNIHDTQ